MVSAFTFLCFGVLSPIPSGYGQNDQASQLMERLRSSDPHVREEAVRALGQIKDARAVGPLIVTLKDADPFVRLAGSSALAKIGTPAVEALIATLVSDADANTRRYAAEALGSIKDARAVRPLIAALRDPDKFVRMDSAEALGTIGDGRTIEPLISLLNDTDWQVQKKLSEAILSFGEAAVEPLIAALSSLPPHQGIDWQARRNAAMVLGEIRIAPASEDERAVARLLTGLKEHDDAVIVGACRFFVRRGEPRSEAALIQALNAKGDSDMAEAFLNSGNFELEPAARRWASEHGYRIASRPKGSSIQWGSQP